MRTIKKEQLDEIISNLSDDEKELCGFVVINPDDIIDYAMSLSPDLKEEDKKYIAFIIKDTIDYVMERIGGDMMTVLKNKIKNLVKDIWDNPFIKYYNQTNSGIHHINKEGLFADEHIQRKKFIKKDNGSGDISQIFNDEKTNVLHKMIRLNFNVEKDSMHSNPYIQKGVEQFKYFPGWSGRKTTDEYSSKYGTINNEEALDILLELIDQLIRLEM